MLPALSVMNKLHQQPFEGSRAYNVELMGYDDCAENLDLIVGRETHLSSAFGVFIQALFLPFFVLVPPIRWIQIYDEWIGCYCCNNKKCCNVRSRVRPVESEKFQFEVLKASVHIAHRPIYLFLFNDGQDLDRAEQVPLDITALWRDYRVPNTENGCCRIFSFFVASIFWFFYIFGGPFHYFWEKRFGDAQSVQFFDCFGPPIFYGLGTLTVICWSGHSRFLIEPKEHLLLYNKLLVHRPSGTREELKQRYDPNHPYSNIPRTDWAAMTNLSQTTLLDTFTFAYRKGFLEIRSVFFYKL